MIKRELEVYIRSIYDYFPVIFLTGPRQSGKTTLCKSLFSQLPYVLLEQPDQRHLAQQDPRSFLAKYPGGAILDEIQNVPEIFSYLQGIVDNNREVRFILTGSQNFLLNERITQSLAGRAGIVTLLPLSLREMKDQIADSSYEDWIVRGFYPELYNRKVPATLFYPSYVQTYLERDVRTLQNVGSLSQFNTFLKLCAGRTGQLLNMSALASDAGVSVNTAKAWISVLEASYIIFRLQPHYMNYNKRLVKSPKIYFTDTGMACHLLGIENTNQLSSHYAIGSLFENFVIMECLKQQLALGKRNNLYFWRDSKGKEIDLLLDRDQHLYPFEIKAGRTANSGFFDNLRYWQTLSKSQSAGTVIYGGNISQALPFGTLKSWMEITTIF
ncbi:MAG: ATP-binding protein [Flammeovirgaceae bacterium]|nr:ATP-binding protein [Flammeovirgaceae bacterium]